MTDFYSRLSYSIGNEDWRSEQKALQTQPTDRILCVTASGDRPLNLLSSPCQEIVSVDANPIQNALLDLKMAALTHLDYEEYLSFLGLTPKEKRLATFDQLSEKLHSTSCAYWSKHRSKIAKGIIYQGATEKISQLGSLLVRFLRRKKINALFSFDKMEEQKEFVSKKWQTTAWKKTFDLALHPVITRLFLKDPGLYQHVDPSLRVSTYVHDRINDALTRFPAKESIILSLALQGKIYPEAYSPYLTEEGVQTIKQRLDKIQFHTANLIDFLETAPENSFDCFALSDVASYMSEEHFARLVSGLYRVAKPGARFCLRQFTSRYDLPDTLKSRFQRDTALEQEPQQEDRCFLYNFIVGKVLKDA